MTVRELIESDVEDVEIYLHNGLKALKERCWENMSESLLREIESQLSEVVGAAREFRTYCESQDVWRGK